MQALPQKRGFAKLLIGHDIEIMRWVSDRIAGMHRGKVTEQGETGAASPIRSRPIPASRSPRCRACRRAFRFARLTARDLWSYSYTK